MNPFYKNLSMWLVIGMTMILLFNLFNTPQTTQTEISYSDFLSSVEAGAVTQAQIQADKITGTGQGGNQFIVITPPSDPELLPLLRESGVNITVKQREETPWYVTILISWFPMLLLIGVWIFFMRQMQMGGGKAMSFGKSRHRRMDAEETKVTFADVAGIDEAKEELAEIIDFLKEPQKYTRLGGHIPKGVLLMGAPGTGKTLLARAIAGEADVPFFSISGSDFVEMFVGVGASRVRDLFEQGKKNAPCIIFIDEIDAVGRHRGAGLGGGHDEREQTLNQLLVEMDGFESKEGVIIISATNRPDVLDPALLRPGRFDRQVVVPIPDIGGREKILEVHAKKVPLADDVKWKVIARGTPGFTGADLANLINEAAIMAARQGADKVNLEILEKAKDKIMMGAERRSMIITDKEKKITAFHEAGHALTARLLPGTDPVHKVTIIPRGRALGLTQQLPTVEQYTHAKSYLLNNVCILLGGRVAEELVFGEITTGSGNDIERATELARKMVCEWGMSEELGPLTFGKKEEQIFLGREIAQHRDYSERTAIEIDQEVKHIVTGSNDKVTKLLSEHMDALKAISHALLERETLVTEELDLLINGETLPKDMGKEPAKPAAQAEKPPAPEAPPVETVSDKKDEDLDSPQSPPVGDEPSPKAT